LEVFVGDTIFALFDRPDNAARAAAELQQLGTGAEHLTVVVHADQVDQQQLPVEGTRAVNAAVWGVLAGAVLGPLLGWLLAGPLGLLPTAPASAALMGAVGGALMGALGGGLMGAADPQKRAAQFSGRVESGKTLVTVEAPSPAFLERAQQICRQNGAVIDTGQWSARPT